MKCLIISLGLVVLIVDLVRGSSLVPDNNITSETSASDNEHVADNAFRLSNFIRRVHLNPFSTNRNKPDKETQMVRQTDTTTSIGAIVPILLPFFRFLITGVLGMGVLVDSLMSFVRETLTALVGSVGLANLQSNSTLVSSILSATTAGITQPTASNETAPNVESLSALNNYLSQIITALSSLNETSTSGSTNSSILTGIINNVLTQLIAAIGGASTDGSTTDTSSLINLNGMLTNVLKQVQEVLGTVTGSGLTSATASGSATGSGTASA